jgi:hypothetical protein
MLLRLIADLEISQIGSRSLDYPAFAGSMKGTKWLILTILPG